MSAKASIPGALLTLLVMGTAWCQTPVSSPEKAPPLPAAGGTLPQEITTEPAGPTNWMSYPRPGCCNTMGGNGPILSDLYFRVGPSVPTGGSTLSRVIDIGFEVQGGGRSLFFNTPMDTAWVVDVSVANTWNPGTGSAFAVQGTAVTARDLNRTFVTLGLGRDRFLLGPAGMPRNFSIGMDGGFRLGAAHLNLNGAGSQGDLLAGLYVGLHGDWEVPFGCCTWLTGVRAEWDYNWTDIIHAGGNSGDVMDINALVTTGFRF